MGTSVTVGELRKLLRSGVVRRDLPDDAPVVLITCRATPRGGHPATDVLYGSASGEKPALLLYWIEEAL